MKSGRDLRVVPPVDATRVQIGEPENLPERFAHRAQGMKASEIRSLFAVASRPEIVSLAGGMPNLSALQTRRICPMDTFPNGINIIATLANCQNDR